jgi:phage protein D
MNKADQARRTAVEIKFAGADITQDIKPYLLSVVYTDNEEDKADDLQIRIHDRDTVCRRKAEDQRHHQTGELGE